MAEGHHRLPSESAGTGRAVVASGAVVAIMMATVWRASGGPEELAWLMAAATGILLMTQWRSIPQRLRHTALVLGGTSAVLLPFAHAPLEAIQRGLFVAGLLLALIASITLLGHCALRSTQVRTIGDALRALPSGRRYLSFTAASQLFSGMLGLAGTNIMLVMASPDPAHPDPQRVVSVVATMRGFSAAIFWSPMLGNMAILLAMYPSLSWTEVFPLGMAAAALTVIVGVLLNGHHQSPAAHAMQQSQRYSLAAAIKPLLPVLLLFMAATIAVSQLLGSGISASVVLIGPLAALLLNIAMADEHARVAEGLHWTRRDIAQFPKLANEALLFAAAGCAGSIMAAAFPAAWVIKIGDALSGLPFVAIAFLMLVIMAMSLIGVHPVLTSVFLSSTVTPQALALPELVHFQAILIAWGLSACLTPFTATAMVASRYAGVGAFQITLGRNWLFAIVNALLASAILAGLANLLGG